MLPEHCFYFDSEDALDTTESKLFGYAYTDDALILGSAGLDEYMKSPNSEQLPTEGRFAAIFHEDDEIVIRADDTGQETIFLYASPSGQWAVSNSFLLLVTEVSRKINLTFYDPAALNFYLKEGVHLGEQLVSHKTLVEEIHVVPLGKEVVVNRRTGKASVRGPDFLEKYSIADDETYEDVLLRYLERGAGLIDAFGRSGISIDLNLSGGYDSRLVLALSLLGQGREKLTVSSLPSKADDFVVASALSQRFGLPLNSGITASQPSLSATDAIRLYLMACAGTYLPFYPVTRPNLASNAVLKLTGDQPSGAGYLAGRARFNGDISKIANDISETLAPREGAGAVREDFLGLFSDLGVEVDHPAAAIAYYAGVRSRHHGGRNWYKSLGAQILCTPLMHSDMLGLDIAKAVQGKPDTSRANTSKQRFFADAFSAVGGWVLEEPFENPGRDFSADILESSPFKGGVSINPRSLRVYGSLKEMSENPRLDIYSHSLDVWQGPGEIKRNLDVVFRRAAKTDLGPAVEPEDVQAAQAQLGSEHNLSHQSRRIAHLVAIHSVKSAMGG